MLALEKIVVKDFRNIEFQELTFSPNINCISGNNGMGKTNLMDAIYYLSMTKSAFSSSDKFNFRYGTDKFELAGAYRMPDGQKQTFSFAVDVSGVKKIKKGEKFYKKVSDHVGELPIVMVSPSDIALVSDSGEERRKFTNGVLSQMDREYLTALQQYNRLLMQRNKMLKDKVSDDTLLDVFDDRMSALASKVYESRSEFVRNLTPVVAHYYNILSGNSETVGIVYKSDLSRSSLNDLLKASRQRDRYFGYTTAGVQRDDLDFSMNDYPIRKIGSQGQQKSFLVSLKLAQYEIMRQKYGYAPILLLDDVFDKLDISRISNLLSMVSGNDFGQIFITDSNKVRMSGIVDSLTEDRVYYESSDGAFNQI